MKRPRGSSEVVVPQPGGEAVHEGEAGPLIYSYPLPPVRTRGRLLLGGAAETTEALPTAAPASVPEPKDGRPLVPASEEVARLPRTAREAFAARCAARVAKLRPGAGSPEAAAALLLAAATTRTPLRRQLRCIRRDFDRISLLAKRNNWTDETPVPADVFGPMWPANLVPEWASGPVADNNSGTSAQLPLT